MSQVSDSSADVERVNLKSLDIAEEKREEVVRLFPEARTEGGKIDFDRLKLALGQTVDIRKERFGLTWPGKAECFRTIQTPSSATLRPMREESINFDTTENLIIEGDNLEVLKLLQKAYLGKVKMIYIDPPYNTGNDFIYPDNYAESLQTYLEYTGQVDAEGKKFSTNTETDGRFHSKWLNMMYPRLYLARNLLRDDGAMFVTIDDKEVANLRQIMNEVFGEENFVAQIEWQKRYTRSNNTDNFTSVIDHICLYQKSEAFRVSLLPRDEEANARFTNPDDDPRGPWKATPFLNQVAPDRRPNLCYPITNPFTGKTTEPSTKAWRYERSVFERLLTDNRLYWGKDKSRDVPDIKTFLSEVRSGMTPINLWTHEYAGHTDLANREIKELLGEKVFDTPKPSLLVKRMLEHCQDKDALVLDFFAGSGTTGQAVLDLNQEDGGNRYFVLIQLPEPTGRTDYPTISDMTRKRVRRVIERHQDQELGQLDLSASSTLDRGFRAFTLAESSFRQWNADANNASEVATQLALHISSLRERRSEADILFEILLKSGFPPTATIAATTIAGHVIYTVADGLMVIVIESPLNIETIRGIAGMHPERVVCLEECFQDDDDLKANAAQIFRTKGVTSFKTL
jgi:adenine-specific DNA-methyltransferase